MPTETSEKIRKLAVVGRRTLADRVIELELGAVDGALPEWWPGAHIDLRLGADLIRQYSLVAARRRRHTWTIAVLHEPQGRGGSAAIERNLQVGAVVDTSGPRNHFELIEAPEYLFIAGGIGITPLIAMCRAAEAAGAVWRLAYLGRSRSHMAYLDELIAEFGDRVEVFDSEGGRRLDIPDALAGLSGNAEVYCCGPERLMEAVEAAMPDGGIERVHTERFHPRETAASPNEEFTVYAAKSDVEFVVPEDESILVAADFEGILVPGDCLEGTCGSCETRLLLGAVEHRDSVLSAARRARSETLMICVSRAAPGCTRLELEL